MKAMTKFAVLYTIQLYNLRWAWRWLILGGLVLPLSIVFVGDRLAAAPSDEDRAHLMAAYMVAAILFVTFTQVANRFSFLRSTGGVDYYATLPISRFSFVASIVAAFLTLAAPGLILGFFLGRLMLDLAGWPHPIMVPVLIVGALTFASLGAIVGNISPSFEATGSITQIITFAVLFFSPVLLPAEALPVQMVWLSKALPSTYMAEALTDASSGPIYGQTYLDLAVLCCFALGTSYLSLRSAVWRYSESH